MEEQRPERCGYLDYMEVVQRRDAATLLPIIAAHTALGTIIHSDDWAAYRRVQALPNVATHGVVNHSLNFVEPVTVSTLKMWKVIGAGSRQN